MGVSAAPRVARSAEHPQPPEWVATPGNGNDVVGGQVVRRSALVAPRMHRTQMPRAALVLGAVGVRPRARSAAARPLRDQAAATEAGAQNHAGRFGTLVLTGTALLPEPVGGGVFGIGQSSFLAFMRKRAGGSTSVAFPRAAVPRAWPPRKVSRCSGLLTRCPVHDRASQRTSAFPCSPALRVPGSRLRRPCARAPF